MHRAELQKYFDGELELKDFSAGTAIRVYVRQCEKVRKFLRKIYGSVEISALAQGGSKLFGKNYVEISKITDMKKVMQL